MRTTAFLTPFQRDVLEALKECGGEASAAKLRRRLLDRSAKGVVNALRVLRGLGFVAMISGHKPTRWRIVSENGREASVFERDHFKVYS